MAKQTTKSAKAPKKEIKQSAAPKVSTENKGATQEEKEKLSAVIKEATGGGATEESAPNTEQEQPQQEEPKKEESGSTGEPPASEQSSNPPQEEKGATESKNDPPKDVKKRLSIFSDIAKKTEQDFEKRDPVSKVEEIAQDLAVAEKLPTENEEEDPETKRAMAEISAGLYVTVIDLVFMLLAMWVSDDWTEAAQKKYSLVPERKKALKTPIFQLLMRKKKKANPWVALSGAILGSYAPMMVLAVIAGVNKKRTKREQEERENNRQQENTSNEAAQIAFMRLNPDAYTLEFRAANPHIFGEQPLNSYNNAGGQVVQRTGERAAVAKGSKGRHLHWCNSHKGGACNCAGYVHKKSCRSLRVKGKACDCHN